LALSASSGAWAVCPEGLEENARTGECQPIRETTKSLFGNPSKEQSSVSVISVVSGNDTPTSAVLTGPDPQTAALIEDLHREISSLRDQLDIQTFELEQLRRRQRELYDDLDARLRQEERITASMPMPGESGSAPSSLVPTEPTEPTQSTEISQSIREPSSGVSETEATGSSSNASDAVTDAVTNTDESSADTIVVGSAIQTTARSEQTLNSTTVSNAVSVSEEETYDAAFDLLKQSLYADAAVAFTQFIQRFPKSELTDDAWYWMGEARFVTREFSQSLGAFQNVINNFMDSPRIPASYLKVGYIQYEYGAYIKARETLNFVLSSFPNHRVVANAKARLEKMAREDY
jgi:tol-pal system protein YbgF